MSGWQRPGCRWHWTIFCHIFLQSPSDCRGTVLILCSLQDALSEGQLHDKISKTSTWSLQLIDTSCCITEMLRFYDLYCMPFMLIVLIACSSPLLAKTESDVGGCVTSQDAVEDAQQMKRHLLEELEKLSEQLPPNTLDELIDELGGPENVAEVRGTHTTPYAFSH